MRAGHDGEFGRLSVQVSSAVGIAWDCGIGKRILPSDEFLVSKEQSQFAPKKLVVTPLQDSLSRVERSATATDFGPSDIKPQRAFRHPENRSDFSRGQLENSTGC